MRRIVHPESLWVALDRLFNVSIPWNEVPEADLDTVEAQSYSKPFILKW